jgi:NAD(P)-dependent dehydrogenase (short-subunit alcohol dehydrogenase family)
MRLKNKVAIVTGAGRGIGSQIAHSLSREGAAILVADIALERAEKTAQQINESGGKAIGISVDIRKCDQIEQTVSETIRVFGSLDILVNNAGVGHYKAFLEIPLSEWQNVIDVNLTGTFLFAQAAARKMTEAGSGKIINIASISGERGGHGRAAYGASKAAIILLTKVMAVELTHLGINVNAISPGPVDTVMSRQFHDDNTRAAYHRLIPAKRYGREKEIADAVVFLSSEESSWIAGHTINVDGGFCAAGLMME